MRNAFAEQITCLAREDERVVLLSGDIGNRLFNDFKKHCPSRFFNCGIAEGNMTGMAAGMALCGLRPFTYTITPFNTSRCFEQIRVDVCHHNLPVVIAGVGAGLSYASLGATHHSCEDIAIMRSLPNMTVICPGDAVEVREALKASLNHDGPVYLRLGKVKEPVIHATVPDFIIGKGIIIREGTTACLLNTGNTLPLAEQTAINLKKRGISTRVVSMHTVKPLDLDLLRDAFSRFQLVATVEEHSLIGGLGSSVAEWLADHQVRPARFIRFGTPDEFLSKCGTQEQIRTRIGLDPDSITDRICAGLS